MTPHVATTVTCHAPSCSMFIIAPTGNATVAFKGTVNVEALAFVIVTIFPASVSTNVYVVPVWSFSCNPVVLLVVVNVCSAVKVFATSFFVVSASYACTSVPMASHNVVLASAAEASSVKLAQNVDMVVLAGKTRVFISASTSLSINAPAAVTLAVSVTSAPSSTFIAESNPDLETEPVNHTTDCTASVWSCLLQLEAYVPVEALSVVATILSHIENNRVNCSTSRNIVEPPCLCTSRSWECSYRGIPVSFVHHTISKCCNVCLHIIKVDCLCYC